MITVLKTRGKHDSVIYVSVHHFENQEDAQYFCITNNTGRQKHWVKAEIVWDGEELELTEPEE